MILSVLKTVAQIVNFLLWLLGVSVLVVVLWIMSDLNMGSLSDNMMVMVDMVMEGGGLSRKECHQMSREVVEEVTMHVSDKLCSVFM